VTSFELQSLLSSWGYAPIHPFTGVCGQAPWALLKSSTLNAFNIRRPLSRRSFFLSPWPGRRAPSICSSLALSAAGVSIRYFSRRQQPECVFLTFLFSVFSFPPRFFPCGAPGTRFGPSKYFEDAEASRRGEIFSLFFLAHVLFFDGGLSHLFA